MTMSSPFSQRSLCLVAFLLAYSLSRGAWNAPRRDVWLRLERTVEPLTRVIHVSSFRHSVFCISDLSQSPLLMHIFR